MSAKKSIKENYIFNLSYQLLVIAVPLITTPYLSRVLGADGVGLYSFTESIVSYFCIFANLGLSIYGQREVSYAQEDPQKRTVVFWETKLFGFISSLIVLIVYFPFAFTRDNKALYLVMSFNILSVAFDISWFFQGLEDFRKTVIRNVICKLLNVAFIFLFIKDKDDVILYAVSLAFFTFVGNISLWIMLPKYLVKVHFSELRIFKNTKTILSLFLPTIATQIYTVLDKTMIGLITESEFENGFYEQAFKISKASLAIITAFGAVMVPRIGFYFARKEDDSVKYYMYRGYRFVWMIGMPITLGLAGISSNLIPWFCGPGFEKAIPILSVLSLLVIAIGLSNVTGTQYLVPTKRESVFTLSLFFGAFVNLACNLLLIKKYQAFGAAIASVIAEFSITVFQLIYVRKELKISKILFSGVHYFIASAVMFVAVIVTSHYLDPSIINTVVLILVGAITYFAVLLLVRDVFFIECINSVLKKIKKKRV